MDDIVQAESQDKTPVRGSLRINVTTSSPQVSAGTDFSIFVIIQNPFDVPITIYKVETHVPVDLIDVNGLRLAAAQRAEIEEQLPWYKRMERALFDRLGGRKRYSGVAVAVGTEFDPEVYSDFTLSTITVSSREAITLSEARVTGIEFNFPQNPSSEELDRIYGRLLNYRKGLIPTTLQPGDSTVRQFVLKTRNWLFFTPLAHTFQIQVNYSSDRIDHAQTVTYEQSVASTIGAISIGAVVGATVGTLLRSLTTSSIAELDASVVQAMIVSILASLAVVVAFARKSTAQPIVSVEDFWGGALIGFTTGFFGFDQFFGLFSP